MLVRFVISNFLSFDKETQFDMLPAPGRITHHKHHIYKTGKAKVVKSTAIYGANGAGKSNLIYAFRTLQQWVKDGCIHTPVERLKFRLNKENQQLPVSFSIEFYTAGKLLLYGLSVDDKIIINEFLYQINIGKQHNTIFEHHASKQTLHLRPDAASPEIKAAYNWITQQLIIRTPRMDIEEMLQELCTNEQFFKFSNELLSTFDTGIDYLTLEKTERTKFLATYDPEGLHPALLSKEKMLFMTSNGRVFTTLENDQIMVNKLTAFHHDVAFDLIEESSGTQRLLEFLPVFWTVLNYPSTIIMDEIDQNIHPVLLIALIRKINHTPTKGQLILTTHESHLLDLDFFRKDEIWFACKGTNTGATELYSLSEFKNVPRNLDPHKGYFLSRFDAIPFTASLELLKLKP